MTEKNDLFWQLLQPEYEKTLMFCRKLSGDREKGDDLYQDSLYKAIRKFDQLKDQSAFRSWLYTVIISTFHSTLRRQKIRQYLPFTAEVEPTFNAPNQLAKYKVDRLFRKLSAEERSLVVLYEMEQWTISELARLMDKSEGAIKQKLFRTRQKMKSELEQIDRALSKTLGDLNEGYLL